MAKRKSPIVGPRHIAIGTRCKLLTGSYKGKTKDCPCAFTGMCKLTKEQRRVLRDFPLIKKRAADNHIEHEHIASAD